MTYAQNFVVGAMLAVASGGCAAQLTPCHGGPGVAPCDSPPNTQAAIQGAIDSAAPGDVIELAPGNYALRSRLKLPNKPGASWITIRSSQYQNLPPDGYRLRDADRPLLAVLYTTTAAEPVLSTPQAYTRLPAAKGPFSVTISGNTLTIGADCSSSAPCRMMTRSGTVLSFTSPVGSITLKPPLTSSGSLTIGIDNAGRVTIGKRPDITAGTQFTCTNCGLIFDRYMTYSNEYEPNSLPIANKTYDPQGWTMDSAWNGGYWSSTRIFATGPWAANGGYGIYGPEADAPYTGAAAGPHHYRFKGIGFAIAPRTFQYWLVGVGVDSLSFYDYRDMPHDFEFDQCLFTGEREYPSPAAALRLRAENVTVKNSLFRWTGTAGQDGQQISIMDDCPGPLTVENNDLDGASENIMAGGGGAILAGYVPSATYRRNYIWKRLDHRVDFDVRKQTANAAVIEFYLNPAHNGTAGPVCSAAPAGKECKYWYNETEYQVTQDTSVMVAPATSGQGWIAYDATGIYFFHNMGPNVRCSGQIACVPGRTTVPDGYKYFSAWQATNGAWSGLAMGRVFQKNLWECKNCKDTVVEGNLFHQYWQDQQMYAFALTPRNQNGGEPWVRMDNLQIRRNKIIGVAQGINTIGLDDGGLQTYAKSVVFSHNIWNDVDGPRWNPAGNTYTYGMLAKIQSTYAWLELLHNTARIGGPQAFVSNSRSNTDPNIGSYLNFRNNLFAAENTTQFAGDTVGFSGWSGVSAYTAFKPRSEYSGNLNLSSVLSGKYPAGNYFSPAAFSTVFTKLSTPGTLSDDLRLLPGSPWSAQCTSGCYGPSAADGSKITDDGLDVGADVDWVETLTDGVREGLPPLAARWDVQATPSHGALAISFAPPSGATFQFTLSSHQNMRASNVVAVANRPTSAKGKAYTLNFRRLAPATTYWYTLRIGSQVVKDSIVTR